MVPGTATVWSLLAGQEVVHLNHRHLPGHGGLALSAELGDLLLEFDGGEVRENDQAAGEGWYQHRLTDSQEIIFKTFLPVSRQIAVG